MLKKKMPSKKRSFGKFSPQGTPWAPSLKISVELVAKVIHRHITREDGAKDPKKLDRKLESDLGYGGKTKSHIAIGSLISKFFLVEELCLFHFHSMESTST